MRTVPVQAGLVASQARARPARLAARCAEAEALQPAEPEQASQSSEKEQEDELLTAPGRQLASLADWLPRRTV